MDPEEELETRFYLFRLHLRKAAKAWERLEKKGDGFELKISATEDGGVDTSFTTPDEKLSTEFAVLMSRFLLPGSPLHIENVFHMMGELSKSEDMNEFTQSARTALAGAKDGMIQIERNGTHVTAEGIFIEIAQNVLFCDDTVRFEYLRELRTDSLLFNIYWHSFYDYCIQVFRILDASNRFVEEHRYFPKHVERQNWCILCGTMSGEFREVEHIIPEALGNDDFILPRGYICNECNKRLSPIEQVFINSLPISMLRIFCTPYGKKGKFPAHRYPGVVVEKTSPNSMRLLDQGGRTSISPPIPDGEGTVRFSINVRDNRKFDQISTARALFKIALGAIAARQGRDFALDPRFDKAREFIRNGGTFPNRLVIVRSAQPRTTCTIQWGRGAHGGLIVELNLLGAIFIVGLEPDLLVFLHEDLTKYSAVYDLWDDSPGPHHGGWTSNE